MENEERNNNQNNSEEGFGSKKTSIILIVIILLLLIASAVVLLSGGDSDKELVAVPPQTSSDDFETLSPFVTEGLSYEGYDEEISAQYEEYVKEKNDSKKNETKDEPKNPSGSSSNGGNSNSGSTGGSNNGGSNSGGGSGNSGGSNNGGSSNGSDPNGIILPPINIGGDTPTVPKLPDDNIPPVVDNGGGDVDPTDPTDPVDPDPTDPTDPTDPVDPVNPNPTDPVNPNPVNPTDPVDPKPTDPNNPDPTVPDGGTIGGSDSFGDLTVYDTPQNPIDTSSHAAMSGSESEQKYGGNSLGTTYQNSYNVSPVSAVKEGAGAIFTFDIYNKTNSVMEISYENLFIVYYGSNTDTGYLGQPKYSIQPKSVQRVILVAHDYNTSLVMLKYGNDETMFNMLPAREANNDKNPHTDGYTLNDDGINYPMKGIMDLNGNAEFKSELNGIKVLSDKKLNGISVGDKGTIGLVKVKITNTSDKPLKVLGADLFSYSGGSNKSSSKVTFSSSEFSVLGGAALPTEIPAKTIAYGYVPFYLADGNHTSDVAIKLQNESGKQFNAYVRDASSLPLIPSSK